jgi:tetratricopeptide (TPR) repeat protein
VQGARSLRVRLLSLALLGLALGAHLPALSFAQEAPRLKRFYDAYSAEKYEEARKRGTELLRSRLSPFEVGTVERVLADIAQHEGRWSDARGHLQGALASGGLDDLAADAARHQIVVLFLREERWRDAVDAWNAWAAAAPAAPGPEGYGELALAYFELEDFERALEPARKAVELSKQPGAQSLSLLIAIQLRREAYADAAPLLRTLLAVTPEKREVWVRLAGVHVQLGNEAEAAQSMQIAYYGGLLTNERDLRGLSQLLVQIGIPHRAARTLAAAIERDALVPDAKRYQFLGETWIAAQEYERAVEPLTKAADLSEDGNLQLRSPSCMRGSKIGAGSWPRCAPRSTRGCSPSPAGPIYYLASRCTARDGPWTRVAGWNARSNARAPPEKRGSSC